MNSINLLAVPKFPTRSLPAPPAAAPLDPVAAELSTAPWYGPVDRKEAEMLVRRLGRDGGFLVRDSKHGGPDSPFTLTLFNQVRLHHELWLGTEYCPGN